MKRKIYICLWVLLMGSVFSQVVNASDNQNQQWSLNEAINRAKANDPWLKMSQSKQSMLEATAVIAGQLNDPIISVGLANIGADRFDFNQEPMSQFKVGVTQMFPRGKTRVIKTDRQKLLANQQPLLRENRLALLTKEVSMHWLNAYKSQKSVALIEKDRPLFEQLIDLVEASYSSGFGQTRQQDLIRAQLELSRLDDRLTVLNQNFEKNLRQLNGLIRTYEMCWSPSEQEKIHLPSSVIPKLKKFDALNLSHDELLIAISKHPAVKAMDIQIAADRKNIDLAQQKYKPAWGLNASYGYRGNSDDGSNRADLFSVGVSFELPLFTKNRQDQEVKAAAFTVEGQESKKSLLVRDFVTLLNTAKSQLVSLNQRRSLFEHSLIPQMTEQAEASLNAYTHDDGEFAEVIRARIAELNVQIDALAIEVETAKIHVQINYLLTGIKESQPINPINQVEES